MDLVIQHAGVYEVWSNLEEKETSAHLRSAIQFYIEYENDKEQRVQSDKCYFNVDPILSLPKRTPVLDVDSQSILPLGQGGKVEPGTSAVMPTDGLVLQSVIGKWMGKLSEWGPHLDSIRDRGYNMLHFTPLQERGISNSPYSIYNQLSFADDLFEGNISVQQKQAIMKEMLAKIRDDRGMLSLTDVVWNHTANNSDWLLDHPDAGYNALNSPHLESALELDRALYQFACDFEKLGLPADIQTAQHLDQVLSVLKTKIIPDLKLWQYYVINITSEKERLAEAWERSINNGSVDLPDLKGRSHIEEMQLFEQYCLSSDWRQLGARFHAQVNLDVAGPFLRALCGDDLHLATERMGQILDELHVDQYKVFDDDVKAILENTRSRIQYQRIDSHGPKLGPVSSANPLVDRFFTELPMTERTKKHDQKALALANNGWIWNADPLQDFASAQSRAYTRREVIAWGEYVKNVCPRVKPELMRRIQLR